MEISPEMRESVKTSLSFFMGEEETERFLDLSYPLTLLKRGQTSWQALVSIGVHIANLYSFGKAEAEKAILKDITDYSLEPLEASIESLTPKSGEQAAIENERARLLFHNRFALGFLMLAKGKKDYAKKILHEMAATKLSVRGNEFRSGPGIVNWTRDIAQGKWLSAFYLMAEYRRQEDYQELLFLMTEAAACNSPDTDMVYFASVPLDLWVARCEKEDDSRELDFPDMNWLDVFAAAADILSVCQKSDSSNVLPNECKKESPQFLAWKFGQIVGRFAYNDIRWREDPLVKLSDIKDFISDQYEDEPFYKMWHIMGVVATFLSEYDLKRDWRKLREHYIEMWKGAYTYRGTSLSEISPESDLYWAMRIGFADKILELMQQVETKVQVQPALPNLLRDVESIKEIVSAMALHQRVDHERIIKRLPESTKEIQCELEGKLGSVWRELPSKVVNPLVKAEKYYRTGVNDDDAKVWFNKSVEASLNFYMVRPLLSFLQKRGHEEINICLPSPSGLREGRPYQKRIGKLALWEWGAVLETLINPSGKTLSDLGNSKFREFMKTHLGGSRFPDFRSLSESLRTISSLKGSSSHYKDADSRYESEKSGLERMRNLVLGINGPSVIVQIFQLLKAKSSS